MISFQLKTKELECGKLEKEIETLQDQLKETELEKQVYEKQDFAKIFNLGP